MKVLVTGAKGQLGSDLGPRLEAAGFDVVSLGSGALDITDPEKTREAVSFYRPRLIVNCGAYTKVDLAEKERDRAFAVNSAGAANLAGAAEKAGAALIHISTDFVYDGTSPVPYTEESITNPLSVYGESKLAGENEIIRLTERHVIVRTSWLYGVVGHNFVKTMLKLASERDRLKVVYDQVGTPTWSADLADALTGIAKAVDDGQEKWGLYQYSNEGVASWYDFAEMIISGSSVFNVDIKCRSLEPIRTAEYPLPAKRPAFSVMDKQKIKKTFGVSIPHWRGSLMKMLNELYGGSNA